MLVADVAAKAVRDRTPQATTIGLILAVGIAGMIAMGSAMKDTFDDLTADLPEAYAGIIGSAGGNYVVTASFGLIAPIAVLVIAISAGTRAFAREENRRTADLLLTQPVTRRDVVVSKAAVMVTNITLACAMLAIGGAAAAAVIDLDGVTPGLVVAGAIHVYFLGLAFGMMALAVANVTGSASIGTGVAVGVAVVSNLMSGLLPLVGGLEWAAKLSPWYYFNGSEPTTNGVDIIHLGVLLAVAVAAFAVAYVVVELRDVGSYRGGSLPKIPAIGLITRPKVSTIFTKSLSERQTLLVIGAVGLAGMAVAIGAMYSSFESTLADVGDKLPDSLGGLIGTTEIGTPAGWVQAEMMSIVVPFALLAIGVVIGVGAIAGEDDRHTLPMLIAGPVTRRQVVLEKAAALVLGLVAIGILTSLGLWLGSVVGGLDLGVGNMFAGVGHATMLGIFFGTLALAVGSKWSKSTALQITIGVALAAYLGDWLLGISDSTDQFAAISPWFYMSDAEALVNGANIGYLAVLAALSIVAIAAAVFGFERREVAA